MATITQDVVGLKQKWVSSFRDTRRAGRELLGGKGAELAEMTAIGLPVPPGFTVSTAACVDFYSSGKTLPAGLENEVRAGINRNYPYQAAWTQIPHHPRREPL